MSSIIQPYQISVPDSAIERLQKKLSLATFPGQTTYSNDWKYGAPLEDVKQLVDFWKNEYDWRKTEAEINKLPQFTTRISVDGHEDDLKIHFIHQKSEKPDSIPLLFCHGFTQGGDWGFLITRAMGFLYPNHVLASHLNFVLTLPPSPLSTPLLVLQYLTGRYTASEKAGLERTQWFRNEGSGYSQIHSTKPHTVGFSLADSPVALLAWIYEKLREWTDDYPWSNKEIIDWISIYYFSEAGADASIRLYYEILHPATAANGSGDQAGATMESFMKWSKIPLGLSYFPKDVIVLPSSWGRTLGPVVFEKRHEEGGHFAAYEKLELM